MALTEAQKDLVQTSFKLVEPIADTAADIFYTQLFLRLPEVKPLFKSDLTQQGKKLMGTLSVAVKSLDKLDALVPVLQNLAIKHIDYGVKQEHYPPVGEALLATLEIGLGEHFTEETKQAWAETYGLIQSVMCEAAYAENA